MNRLVFGKIRVKNVLSIGSEVEYDFRNGQGLSYVYGVNKDSEGASSGVGKSTVFTNALLLAIYGKTINNINNAYIYNRQASWKEGGYIELEVNRNIVDNFIIFVELKVPKKKDKCSLKFTVYKNGEDITCSTKNETLQYIEEEIIGCSFDIFKNTVIISSSNLVNFFQMPMAIKNKYLQGIFSLDNIGNSYAFVTDKITEIKKNIKAFSDKLFYINKTLDEVDLQNADWIQQHNVELTNLKEKLVKEQAKLDPNYTGEGQIEKPKNYDKKLAAVEKYLEYKDKKTELSNELKTLQSKILDCQAEIKTSQVLLKKNEKLMESLCDECKPSIRKLFALDSAEENIKNNINLLNEYQTKKNEIDNSLDKLSNFLEQILQAKLEIKDYNNKIKLLKQEQKHIKTNIESYIKRINKVETEENPFLKLLTDNQEAKIETEKTLNKATKMQQYFGVLKFIFSDDGVKRFIIGDIIEALNNHIRNYLIKMGADFIVYFDNNLYYEFVTQTGPCEYFSFSAGERRKLDLAILFAFRDILSINSVQTNILVVDEVLDSSIDTVSLNAVVQILKNKAKLDGQSIFVISHREALRENQELFNHVIRVEREKGLTTIEQEN